ncbi:hypothetical protein [Nocardia sp. NPDC058705]|uniref:hypothetical protein n=1 Tax=Nocardia sp. NPDC058705 TaxID=3346609 RepID=UPI003679CBD3
MGTQLFEESAAQLFMLAGAHRKAGDDSADVAHRDDSTFAAVHDAVVRPGSPLISHLARDLENHGFDTCVYDGKKCKALGATTNVQGIQARTRGADFIHIEVDRDTRDSKTERTELMRVINETLRAAGVD